MLRITTESRVDGFLLKLEGSLVGAWVEELDRCWRDATKSHGHRPVRVDLRDVWFVDEAGRRLLTRMHRAGAGFMARGCAMPELLREISESSAAGRRRR